MSASGDHPDPWAGLLDPGEDIRWQGRPDGRIVFRPANLFTFVFGLFFAGFALFWMVMASQAGGIFWMFGLLHFAAGLAISVGALFWSAWRRRHTWYTLTDTRAFIATHLPVQGRSLKSYPITADTVLELEPGDPATIWFAETSGLRVNNRPTVKKIGFERIPDGTRVYALMRDIQRGAA